MSKVLTVNLTVADLDERLRAIGEVENRIATRQAALDEAVARARALHTETLQALADEAARLKAQLTIDALRSREQLLAGGKGKTVRTTHGEIRYQQQPLKVEVPRSATAQAAAIDGLKNNGLDSFIRIVEEIDRGGLTAVLQSSREDPVLRAKVEASGLRIVGGQDDVLIKPNHEVVRGELQPKGGA